MNEWEKRFEDMMGEIHGTNESTYEAPKKEVKKEKKYITKKAFVITIICCVIFSSGLGFGFSLLANKVSGENVQTYDKTIIKNNYTLVEATGSELTIQEIAAMNESSVVAITTETVTTNNYWFGNYVTQGAGSGVVFKEDGYILTNNHVIENANSITVTMSDGTEYPATLVATDSLADVAVIKIEAKGLNPVTFGKKEEMAVGDLAVAIGNPLGTLSGTVTEGIISALDREITVDDKPMTLIQTSASINPGNSGGGLFNQYGELIGLVVAKSGGTNIEGLGFAIPCDTVLKVANDLVDKGYVTGRPQIGISIVDLTSVQNAMKYGVQMTGVYINEVTGTNAKKAGLKEGDMVYMIDGKQVTSSTMLISTVKNHEIGDKVKLTIVRNNEMIQVDVVLEAAN